VEQAIAAVRGAIDDETILLEAADNIVGGRFIVLDHKDLLAQSVASLAGLSPGNAQEYKCEALGHHPGWKVVVESPHCLTS
jgi:hypothetical protein